MHEMVLSMDFYQPAAIKLSLRCNWALLTNKCTPRSKGKCTRTKHVIILVVTVTRRSNSIYNSSSMPIVAVDLPPFSAMETSPADRTILLAQGFPPVAGGPGSTRAFFNSCNLGQVLHGRDYAAWNKLLLKYSFMLTGNKQRNKNKNFLPVQYHVAVTVMML